MSHAPQGPAERPETTLLAALLIAGQRLAEALRAENAALSALDLGRAATLAEAKIRATDAFAGAQTAAARAGARASGNVAGAIAALAADLGTLGEDNRRLLQRAVSIQSRVVEAIAGAAAPRASPGPRYGATGQRALVQQAAALALQLRA